MQPVLPPDRKRLIYRAMHRGFKEADLIIGRFAQAYVPTMSGVELIEFETLLEFPDQELYGWIIGREPVPEHARGPVMEKLCDFDVAAAADV